MIRDYTIGDPSPTEPGLYVNNTGYLFYISHNRHEINVRSRREFVYQYYSARYDWIKTEVEVALKAEGITGWEHLRDDTTHVSE
jgi:hypothetical protein